MGRIKPSDQLFKAKDNGFYLDAKLVAIVNGSTYDFMGKSIFTSSFFRESIGFGITNIDIEVNTSLQPIITITFKDLYGNAVFGKNVLNNKNLTEEEQKEKVDFSVLFNWPPPKFLFTFKGFLGRQVSWLLNLKQTSTTYQSDGSYDIKCEFVPNQWGFMADLPFLFLLAVKGLKKRELTSDEFKKQRTIFDLIKIGKSVEVKTKGVTKEFDGLLQQMTMLKSGRIVEALVSNIIKLDEKIEGKAGKLEVVSAKIDGVGTEFKNIIINTPQNTSINNLEKIKEYSSGSPEALSNVNKFLLLNATIDGIKTNGTSLDSDFTTLKDFVNVRTKIISDNIKIIDAAIRKRSYDASKTQLRQITIGEIFQQLAQDSGYIMGRILQAGLEGSEKIDIKNPDRKNVDGLIGLQFPLVLENSEEVPYDKANVELQFVDDFISALSEGIAANSAKDSLASSIGDENALIKRINNLEALQGNPYVPFYRNITENILVRSGIIAFLTRSDDPNYPGDFGRTTNDRDTIEEVTRLASADMENITTDMLASLNDEDFLKLKRFCRFWVRFISTNGESFLNEEGDAFANIRASVGELDLIYNYGVVIDKAANPVTKITLRQVINSVFTKRGNSLGISSLSGENTGGESGESFDSSNASLIDLRSLRAATIYNNNILYQIPKDIVGEDVYTYVLFEGSDATKAKEVNNASSDAELKNSQPNEDDNEDDDVPKGFIVISTYADKDGDELKRVEYLNDRFGKSNAAVLDYKEVSAPSSKMFTSFDEYQKRAVYSKETKIVPEASELSSNNQIVANNLVYTIAYHHRGGIFSSNSRLVFGLFEDSIESTNHRACVVSMCKTILDRMNALEEEKNKVISAVLGNATEQKTALYKQFHVLYHQWESLIYNDPIKDNDLKNIEVKLSSKDITNTLETRYGDKNKHVSTKSNSEGSLSNQIKLIPSNSFIYDYPLNTKAGINVKNSIINIEPLYKPDGNTTVLNIIQQICTKNHFTFVPIPGNGDFTDYAEIFKPTPSEPTVIKNLFYIMFSPTPESRVKINNNSKELVQSTEDQWEINQDIFEVRVGDPSNKIFKGVSIDTYENKATAESIVNLQRLTDNQNQNKKVTTDCSMLPVMEGRSYKASFDMLGNAQVFPMQYFYLDSIPLFDGIYQVMKVTHNISPNDMTTKAEGIRMRFSKRELGGIQPITLEYLDELSVEEKIPEDNSFSEDDFDPSITVGIDATGGNKGFAGNYNSSSRIPSLNDKQKENLNLLLKQMDNFGITNQFTKAAILSVVYKESGFFPRSENLNYSAKRIRQVWPATSESDSIKYSNKPQAFGDWKYGNKFGNNSNEGYKFRGRGYNQITFKASYEKYGNLIGVDLIKDPDKLNNPIYAGRACLAFFNNGVKNFNDEQKSYYNNGISSLNGFSNLQNAVGGIYHINAGLGKSISRILSDTTGGRKKAFSVSEYMLKIVKEGKV